MIARLTGLVTGQRW